MSFSCGAIGNIALRYRLALIGRWPNWGRLRFVVLVLLHVLLYAGCLRGASLTIRERVGAKSVSVGFPSAENRRPWIEVPGRERFFRWYPRIMCLGDYPRLAEQDIFTVGRLGRDCVPSQHGAHCVGVGRWLRSGCQRPLKRKFAIRALA